MTTSFYIPVAPPRCNNCRQRLHECTHVAGCVPRSPQVYLASRQWADAYDKQVAS